MDAPFLSWRLQQARLKGAPTPLEVKYLVFDIEDIAAIAHKLDELYCQGRRKIQALTGDVPGALLDRLHARTRLASGEGFRGGWAGAAFVEMLVDYAVRKKPIGNLLEAG